MFVRTTHASMLVLVAVAVSSCEGGMWSDSDFTGRGPITLNAQQQAGYDTWMGAIDGEPLFFFLAGSRHYRVWCPAAAAALCKNASTYESWQNCESQMPGQCRLYAHNGQVVWKFNDRP